MAFHVNGPATGLVLALTLGTLPSAEAACKHTESIDSSGHLTAPDGVTSIGSYAYAHWHCTSLVSITLPVL